MKWPTVYRGYRCRNPRCRHEWRKVHRCTPLVAAFGNWEQDDCRCPKCGKVTQPMAVDWADS
jgi:hypothetical protein